MVQPQRRSTYSKAVSDAIMSPSTIVIRSFSKTKSTLAIVFFFLMICHLLYWNPINSNNDVGTLENESSPLHSSKNTNTNMKLKFKPKATIAYATSITKCKPEDTVLLDQAAILMYSIHKHSIRAPDSKSQYDYEVIAFVHPEAEPCREILEQIGWTVLMKATPVELADIRGTLRNYVTTASCCGEKEFLKLYSYTLTQYPVVVHLDLDVIVLNSMDDLYDSMIDGPTSLARNDIHAMWQNGTEFPDTIEAFFTRDYNMMTAGRRQVHQIGIQGGFIIVKPNLEHFEEYRQIIMEGNYTVDHGWGDKLAYGGYYGAAQIQGLCSYFYGHVRPNTAVELNRCVYNAMVDSPIDDSAGGKCRTLQSPEQCENCRNTNFSLIKTAHLTLCQKPWWCNGCENHSLAHRENSLGGTEAYPLCVQMHREWFKTRYELETLWSSQDESYKNITHLLPLPTGDTEVTTFGFCFQGRIAYIPMKFPQQKIDLKAL